jgi:hypothetical protein
MIRRGFWMVTGAVLGVTGYRRVTRLARMLTGPKPAASMPGTGPSAGPRMLAPPGRPVMARQVMARLVAGRPASGLGKPSRLARAVAAAGFVRDVRDGMAEYWDLHRGEPDSARSGRAPEGRRLDVRTVKARTLETRTLKARTVETRGDRTLSGEPRESAASGETQQGHRAP